MKVLNLDDVRASKVFVQNLKIYLTLIGSKPAAFSLRTGIKPDALSRLEKSELGLDKSHIRAVERELIGAGDLLLSDYINLEDAERIIGDKLTRRGILTKYILLNDNCNGRTTMSRNLTEAQIHTPEARRAVAKNLSCCLELLGKTAESVGVRADISKPGMEALLKGNFAFNHDTLEAICAEAGLSKTDLLTDFGADDGKKKIKLLLQESGALVSQEVVISAEDEGAAEGATPELSPATTVVEETEERKDIKMSIDPLDEKITWGSDDNVATIEGKEFPLTNKEWRVEFGERIRALKSQEYPNDTFPTFFKRIDTPRTLSWLGNLKLGYATVLGEDVVTFAKFFSVSARFMVTGEYPKTGDNEPDQPKTGEADEDQAEVEESTTLQEVEEQQTPAEVLKPAAEVEKSTLTAATEGSEDSPETPVQLPSAASAESVTSVETPALMDPVGKCDPFFKSLTLTNSTIAINDEAYGDLLFRAGQPDAYSWCRTYLTLTKEGVEVMDWAKNILKVLGPDGLQFIEEMFRFVEKEVKARPK